MFLPGLKIILDVQRQKQVKTGLQITDKHYFFIFHKKIWCIIDICMIAYRRLSIVIVYMLGLKYSNDESIVDSTIGHIWTLASKKLEEVHAYKLKYTLSVLAWVLC